MTGRLFITNYKAGRVRYLLFTSGALVRIKWRLNDPPPGLRQGMRITVYGRLTTFELGGHLTLSQALTIKVKKGAYRRMLNSFLDKIGLTVERYNDWEGPLPSARPPRKTNRPQKLPAWMEGPPDSFDKEVSDD